MMSHEQGDLGFMYLDLYSRKGKHPGCAHFAVQGGRRLSDSNYQLPVCILLFIIHSMLLDNMQSSSIKIKAFHKRKW